MNKREFIEEAAPMFDGDGAPKMSKLRVTAVLDALLADVVRELFTPGDRVSFWPGVGSFVAHWDKARVYTDRKTKECKTVPAHYRLRFREARQLRNVVN